MTTNYNDENENCTIKNEHWNVNGDDGISGSEPKLHQNVNVKIEFNQDQRSHEVSKYVKLNPDGDVVKTDCDKSDNYVCASGGSNTGDNEETHSGKEVTRIQCLICKISVSCTRNLIRHHKLKHGKIPLPSNVEVKSPRKTIKTKDLKDPQNPLKCSYCSKVFTSTSNLRVHIRVHRPPGMQMYSCKFCEKQFIHRCSRNGHQRQHSDSKPYSCSKCDFTSRYYTSLNHHEKICFGFKVQDDIAKKNRQRFHCDLCGKPFNSEMGVYNHKVVTEGNCKVFACNICGRKFYSETRFREHETFAHKDEHQFPCKLCDSKFKLKIGLKSHMKYAHTEWSCTRYGCSVKGLPNKSAWRRHLRECDKPIVCKTCEQFFNSKETYSAHTHPIQCEKCDKTYPKKSQMDLHLLYHDPLKIHKCEGCTFGFASSGEFTTHQKMSHKNDNLLLENFIVRSKEDIYYFTCKFCEAEFEDPSSTELVDHAKTTHSDKTGEFICPDCGKGSKTEFKSFSHRNRVHGPVQTDFKCDICVLYFLTNHGLNSHNRKSHYEIPLVEVAETLEISKNLEQSETCVTLGKFSCLICGEMCPGRACLKRHMTLHSMDKEYKCELCAMSWTGADLFNKHNRARHSDLQLVPVPPKRFECPDCDRSFKSKGNLNNHVRIHTKEKPFKCEVCDKRFMSLDNQTNHMLSHTGEKSKLCDFCGAAFARNKEREIHIRKYHKIEA